MDGVGLSGECMTACTYTASGRATWLRWAWRKSDGLAMTLRMMMIIMKKKETRMRMMKMTTVQLVA